MSVIKHNGFAIPYRSLTFRDQADQQTGQNGVLSMDGAVSQAGPVVTIPPFKFIQDGIIVEVTTPTTVNVSGSIVGPFYVTVYSPTPAQVNDLIFLFAQSPEDVSDSEVLIAEYDGNEWRPLPLVQIAGLIADRDQSNIDFGKVGPVSGLNTVYASGDYTVSPGVVVDQEGRKTTMLESIIFPAVATDPDWSRVDRIIYRRPTDSPDRIGRRELLVGGTYSSSAQTLYDTQLLSNAAVNQNCRVVIGSDDSAHMFVAQGYGDSFNIQYTKYADDRVTVLVATMPLVATTDGNFDVLIDNSDNLQLVYIVDGVVTYQEFNSVGISLGLAVPISTGAQPCSYPAIGTDPFYSKLYFVYSQLLGPSNYQIFFTTRSLTGSLITAPTQITSTASDLIYPALAIGADYLVYVAYQDDTLTTISYEVLNDIGQIVTATAVVSAATVSQSHGTLVNGASYPKIFITDNATLFVTFLQTRGGGNGLAYYTAGAAASPDITGSGENFVAYGAVVDSFRNAIHLVVGQAARTDYAKIDSGTVIMTNSLNGSHGASFAAIARDIYGSALALYSLSLSGTFTNNGGTQNVSAIGPISVIGSMNTIDLDTDEFLFPSGGVVPNVGDQVTIAGDSHGNDGAYSVTSVTLVSLNATNDSYVVSCTPGFTFAENPATGDTAQFATPDGNSARFIKSTTELPANAFYTNVLSSDVLLARIYMPGNIILGYYMPSSIGVNPQQFVVYGDTEIDWSETISDNLTFTGTLKIIDLLNNILYEPAVGSYPMMEGEAIYVILDGTDLTPTPQVVAIDLIPWGSQTAVLGIVEDGEFQPRFLNAADIGTLSPGETVIIGQDLPQALRTRIGFTSDTAYQAYTSTTFVNINDTYPEAISDLDSQATVQQKAVNQNSGLRLINGGNLSFVASSGLFTWSLTMNVAVPGLADSANAIAASNVTMADGDVAYVTINRSGVGGAITVSDIASASYVVGDNKVIIARRIGSIVYVGINAKTLCLYDGEINKLDGKSGFAAVATAMAGETLSANQAVYVSPHTGVDSSRVLGNAYRTDAGAANGPIRGQFAGFVAAAVVSGNTASIVTAGLLAGFSGLTPGILYYLDPSTLGGITSTKTVTAGQWVVPVGIALTSTTLLINAALATTAYEFVAAGNIPASNVSISWVEDDNAPDAEIENHLVSYQFSSGITQHLYAWIKVPSLYITGSQINLNTEFYTADNSGTVLISSIATLVRAGTDLISSVANQHTSVNTAVTLSAGTVNIPQSLSLDLTDGSGTINGVTVSPGDMILITLTRGSDTASSAVRVPAASSEITL